MIKGKPRSVLAGVIVLIVILAGVFVWSWSREQPQSQEAPGTASPLNLGFSYLKVTQGLSAYYSLGVDSGALVTEVVPGGQADRVGIRHGDVIVGFNGHKIDDEVSLLTVMRACPVGHEVRIEVWRGDRLLAVELTHGQR